MHDQGRELLDVGLQALGGSPAAPGLQVGRGKAEVKECCRPTAAEGVPRKVTGRERGEECACRGDVEDRARPGRGPGGEEPSPGGEEGRHGPPVGCAGAFGGTEAQAALVEVGAVDRGGF